MKVDFIAVGPFKTASSWMYNYLRQYESISLPVAVKETYFFDRQDKYDRGLDWYFSYFEDADNTKIKGEVAPSYFHSFEARERIYRLNPECKIIVILREPVSRLVSFYLHMMQRGELPPETSFKEALNKQNILLETGRYYFHLSRWIDIFGRENVEIISYELLAANPQEFTNELCKIIGIEPKAELLDPSRKVNESQSITNYFLSKNIYQITKVFHDRGFHKIVDFGKQLGLKKLLFKKNDDKFELNNGDFAYTLNLIREDIQNLEKAKLLDISPWEQIWHDRGIDILSLN
jgi:hypothetical protein